MSDELSKDQKEIVREIVRQAKELGINPEFAVSLANLESSFAHVPASDKKSTAFGPFQVNKATAEANGVNYDDMIKDRDLAIRTGLMNIARHAKNPLFEGDPARIAAAHRYGEGSDFAKTGDLEYLKKDPVLSKYLTNAAEHFEGGELPESIYHEPTKEEPAGAAEAENEVKPVASYKQPETEIPRGTAGAAGAATGAALGAAAGAKAAALRAKYDALQMIDSFPDARAAFKAGKSPAEVLAIALKHTAEKPVEPGLPPAQGPLTGEPAGGYQTQNWVSSGDTQGRYTDVGLKARDKAEAHQMKLQAMAAEDKIRQIAPEFAADPNRANLFISQSAGRGPSPRFGGTPNAPVPPVAPVVEAVEKPTIMSGLSSLAKHYTPLVKYPVIGGLAGLNLGQGMADAYNKFANNRYLEGALSLAEQGLGYVAPRALGMMELGFHSGELNPNEEEQLQALRRKPATITRP